MSIPKLHQPIKESLAQTMLHAPSQQFSAKIMHRIKAMQQPNVAVPNATPVIFVALLLALAFVCLPFLVEPSILLDKLSDINLPKPVLSTSVWMSIFGLICLYVLNDQFSSAKARPMQGKNP